MKGFLQPPSGVLVLITARAHSLFSIAASYIYNCPAWSSRRGNIESGPSHEPGTVSEENKSFSVLTCFELLRFSCLLGQGLPLVQPRLLKDRLWLGILVSRIRPRSSLCSASFPEHTAELMDTRQTPYPFLADHYHVSRSVTADSSCRMNRHVFISLTIAEIDQGVS